MLTPDTVTAGVIFLLLLFFFFRALLARAISGTQKNRLVEFNLAGNDLGRKEVALSMGASYSAFATVFFWFLALGGGYSYLLILIPISLYYGNKWFVSLMRYFDLNLHEFTTIGNFIKQSTKNKSILFIGQFVVLISIFIGIIVEVNVGSQILTAIFPSISEALFVFILSLTISGYVVIGGYRAVVASDITQIMLAFLGALCLVAFSFLATPVKPDPSYLFAPTVSNINIIAFLMSVVVVQFLGPLCQLHNWQRISAAKHKTEAIEGHLLGAKIGAVLWILMIVAGIILHVKFDGAVNFQSLFDTMKSSDAVIAYALYPMIMAGFVAALLSTADSLLSSLYMFVYDYIPKDKAGNSIGSNFDKKNIIIGIIFVFIMMALYFIMSLGAEIKGTTVTLIYMLFNQLLVIFPMIAFYVYGKKMHPGQVESNLYKKKYENKLLVFSCLGWISVMGVGYYANFIMKSSHTLELGNIIITFESLDLIMLTSIIGVGVASIPIVKPLFGLVRNIKYGNQNSAKGSS